MLTRCTVKGFKKTKHFEHNGEKEVWFLFTLANKSNEQGTVNFLYWLGTLRKVSRKPNILNTMGKQWVWFVRKFTLTNKSNEQGTVSSHFTRSEEQKECYSFWSPWYHPQRCCVHKNALYVLLRTLKRQLVQIVNRRLIPYDRRSTRLRRPNGRRCWNRYQCQNNSIIIGSLYS